VHGTRTGILACLLCVASPALCCADDGGNDGPSVFSYGMRGFWTGAQLGLAIGYLSTGSDFESGEWKNLVVGAGIGAVAGLGTAITLGVLDNGAAIQPGTGWYVLRDVGYGTTLGALAGLAIGAITMIDSGRTKNLLIGASIGALIGGAAGIAIGFIEAGNARSRRETAWLHLTLTALPDDWTPVPTLAGHF
jgi:hypothetical protein